MNRVIGVTTAKNGKTREAVAALKALVEYVNSKYDLKYELYIQLFGTAGTIYLIADYKDVASIQAVQAKYMADNKFWAIAQKAAEVTDTPTITLLQPV